MEAALGGKLSPMLSVPHAEVFDSPDYLYDVLWMGVRVIVIVNNRQVTLRTRNCTDVAEAFPEITRETRLVVRGDGMVLDGELVVPAAEGGPSLLASLTRRLCAGETSTAGRRLPRVPANLEVFDILYKDHEPVLEAPLAERKVLLKQSLAAGDRVHAAYYEVGTGVSFFEATVKLGLGGCVAKRKDSLYEPGVRSRSWLRVAAQREGPVVVGGYTIGAAQSGQVFFSLLVGAYEGKHLRYLGTVSGGFQKEDLSIIEALLPQAHAATSPFVDPPVVDRLFYWCTPRLVLQIKYGELTAAGRLRFPIFRALRPDLDAEACRLEDL